SPELSPPEYLLKNAWLVLHTPVRRTFRNNGLRSGDVVRNVHKLFAALLISQQKSLAGKFIRCNRRSLSGGHGSGRRYISLWRRCIDVNNRWIYGCSCDRCWIVSTLCWLRLLGSSSRSNRQIVFLRCIGRRISHQRICNRSCHQKNRSRRKRRCR